MMPDATTANPERLRERLAGLLEVDRWIEADYPAVAPVREEEVAKLMVGYPGEIMVIGGGSSFQENYLIPADVLVLLTGHLTSTFKYIPEDQVIDISSGWPVAEVRRRLAAKGIMVSALERFAKGSIGGRLAAISSRYSDVTTGWTQSLLGLRVVLPDGEMVNLGGHCIKDVAGYDLKQLFPGSRGSFGVITQATFRCRPWREIALGESSDLPKASGRIAPALRKIIDPKGRMRPGA
jgi:FAD/FMN-containing dehydrogenase